MASEPGAAGDPGGPTVPEPRADSPGPRKEYLDAFDDTGATSVLERQRTGSRPPSPDVTNWDGSGARGGPPAAPEDDGGEPGRARSVKGRTLTGIAAAAVTVLLAVVVAGQVTHGSRDETAGKGRGAADATTQAGGRPAPTVTTASPRPTVLTYEQKMATMYPMDPKAKGSGKFETVPGFDRAPGKGQLFRYRVDVEQGMGLDGRLFAEAVQKTLNDNRSWAHDNGRTFERVSSGKPDFVITLATPGTTAFWCAKSGLDTTEDNVSCDSAATERVMINAYRWARGAKTYGDQIHPYRQMLINHEVGHRLGFNHVTCSVNGALAPVMQQQTKFLTYGGITCKANPWPFPRA